MCQLCAISAHAHTFKSKVHCSSLTTGAVSQFTLCLALEEHLKNFHTEAESGLLPSIICSGTGPQKLG